MLWTDCDSEQGWRVSKRVDEVRGYEYYHGQYKNTPFPIYETEYAF